MLPHYHPSKTSHRQVEYNKHQIHVISWIRPIKNLYKVQSGFCDAMPAILGTITTLPQALAQSTSGAGRPEVQTTRLNHWRHVFSDLIKIFLFCANANQRRFIKLKSRAILSRHGRLV